MLFDMPSYGIFGSYQNGIFFKNNNNHINVGKVLIMTSKSGETIPICRKRYCNRFLWKNCKRKNQFCKKTRFICNWFGIKSFQNNGRLKKRTTNATCFYIFVVYVKLGKKKIKSFSLLLLLQFTITSSA